MLAQEMVTRELTLIYGGGKVGLMGVIADEVLRLGGDAIGVIPRALMEKEVGHQNLTQLHVVKDMHQRKAMMEQLADGFIAMPGGIGTLEELFEILTWSQLGFHAKPIGVLNVNGFYDELIAFLQKLVTQGFVKAEQAALLLHKSSAPALLQCLQNFVPTPSSKILDALAAKNLLP